MKPYPKRWGLIAALPIIVFALLPQLIFLADRGRDWHGANAVMHPDEVAYSAYVGSLIRGRPRRNDPYTGRVDTPTSPVPESLFSIQIVPAYPLALAARFLGLTAANVFTASPIFCAVATSLAMFWFINLLTRDERFAAVSVWVVLGFGTLIARQGLIRHIPNLPYLIPEWISKMVDPPALYHLPFLRLYQPAVAFPLFFLLCGFVWLALSNTSQRKVLLAAIGAGVTFALLIFSYFFLWTAAASWLFCIGALWLLARPNERRRTLLILGVVAGLAVPTLIGYFLMLSHRAATVDNAQALVFSHRPDPFRLCEIVAAIIVLLLCWGVRKRHFQWRDSMVLFTASLALAVPAVFNQQIISGRSLQPIHYEWFIGNYCALVAVVLLTSLWWRTTRRAPIRGKSLAIVAALAIFWGLTEVWLASSLNLSYNRMVDDVLPVATRLKELSGTDGTQQAAQTGAPVPVVLIANLALADRLPTDAPQSLLWAPRMLVFPGVTEDENRDRFFKLLYYLGFDEERFNRELDRSDWNFYAGLFPYSRLSPSVSGITKPISAEEIRNQERQYLNYAQSFSRERAASPSLSYVVLPADTQTDYSNLDRWYQRDGGERIGGFVLYRVRLRD